MTNLCLQQSSNEWQAFVKIWEGDEEKARQWLREHPDACNRSSAPSPVGTRRTRIIYLPTLPDGLEWRLWEGEWVVSLTETASMSQIADWNFQKRFDRKPPAPTPAPTGYSALANDNCSNKIRY